VFYKHSRIKQYLKDGQAMRIETVVNSPRDLGCLARLPHLGELQAKARAANRLLVPLTAANQPQAPPELRAALTAITRHVDDYAARARLPRAA
jgi:hypothetical protein